MKQRFKQLGYCHKRLEPVRLTTDFQTELALLKKNFDGLQSDPYAANGAYGRRRAYSNLIILPWESSLSWIPVVERDGQATSAYWQGQFNPDHQSEIRYFASINPEVKTSQLLNSLIWHDFHLTFWKNGLQRVPLYVGIHFIRLVVSLNCPVSVASPDCVHRDGEAFTFVHLLQRANIAGGLNTIARPECANLPINAVSSEQIKAQFELCEPFDMYGIHDASVSHYVSPIKLKDEHQREGIRDVILIDFSPMKQQLVL